MTSASEVNPAIADAMRTADWRDDPAIASAVRLSVSGWTRFRFRRAFNFLGVLLGSRDDDGGAGKLLAFLPGRISTGAGGASECRLVVLTSMRLVLVPTDVSATSKIQYFLGRDKVLNCTHLPQRRRVIVHIFNDSGDAAHQLFIDYRRSSTRAAIAFSCSLQLIALGELWGDGTSFEQAMGAALPSSDGDRANDRG